MPEVQYQTGDLRTGSAHSDTAAQSAADAHAALSGVGGGSPFGDVSGGDSLHGAVGVARDHHQTTAMHISHNSSMQSKRASNTAALGDDNTTETTKLAPRSSGAAPVSSGM